MRIWAAGLRSGGVRLLQREAPARDRLCRGAWRGSGPLGVGYLAMNTRSAIWQFVRHCAIRQSPEGVTLDWGSAAAVSK
jgi:hypothetical protein